MQIQAVGEVQTPMFKSILASTEALNEYKSEAEKDLTSA